MRPDANRILAGLAAAGALVLTSPAPAGAADRRCDPVEGAFAGTRYADVALTGIVASGMRCPRARRVAVGAQRAALGRAPAGPVLRFRWHGWTVTGDLRPARDRYRAVKPGRSVRWRF